MLGGLEIVTQRSPRDPGRDGRDFVTDGPDFVTDGGDFATDRGVRYERLVSMWPIEVCGSISTGLPVSSDSMHACATSSEA